MKKIIFLGLTSLLLFGCTKDYEPQLKQVSDNYYNQYVKGKVNGLNKIEITLGELRQIKKLQLNDLSNCKDDTKLKLTIKNNKITKYDFEQSCK